MIIIGIDPGIATTGFGVIKVKKGKSFKCLGYGIIQTKASEKPEERLRKLNNELSKLIKKYKADVLAVEKIFFFKTSKTVISVSQAKAVILLTAAKNRIPVFEFSPLQMKLVVGGYGRAEKEKIQKKIKRKLKLEKLPEPDDAADALGIAVCYALKLKK